MRKMMLCHRSSREQVLIYLQLYAKLPHAGTCLMISDNAKDVDYMHA